MKADLKLLKYQGESCWQLTIDKEFKVAMGEKPVCQHCKGSIGIPFYMCEITKKWFCEGCSLKKGDMKIEDEICRHMFKDNHKHFCIRKVVEEGDNDG